MLELANILKSGKITTLISALSRSLYRVLAQKTPATVRLVNTEIPLKIEKQTFAKIPKNGAIKP